MSTGERLMNVLQLLSSLEVGGAEKLLVSMMEAARNDHSIQYVVVVMNDEVNPVLRQKLAATGFPVYYLNRPPGHWHFKYLSPLLQLIDRYDVQVVHVHNQGSKFWGMLCKVIHPSLKLVMTMHNTVVLPKMNKVQHWLHANLIDMHIAISGTVAAQCKALNLHKHEQIYNGIQLKDFHLGVDRYLGPFSHNRPLRIINVARLDYEHKGQDILIRALKICKDGGLAFQCKFVGGVYAYNQQSYEFLRELVRKNGLEHDVEFVVNQTDIPHYLKEADLFILPSRFEGLGLAVLEAMAAGIPVIVSDVDGPRELVQDYVNGYLFESENFYALAEAIKHTCHAPHEVERVTREASRFVQEFDIAKMVEKYKQLYQRILFDDSRDMRTEKLGRLRNEISF